MEHTAQSVSSFDLPDQRSGRWRTGNLLRESLMRSGLIEIVLVFVQPIDQMRLIENEELIQTFFAHGSNPAFSVGIGPRRSKWRADDLNPFGLEDSVEAPTVFPIIIADQMSKMLFLIGQVPEQLARLLSDPSLRWLGGGSNHMDSARSHFNEEKHIQRLQSDCFDGEKIAG